MWRSALVLCLLAPVCGLTPHLDDRIAGGEPVDISQFPWQVSLEGYTDGRLKHFCGGSIISSTWVLTAAHCTKRTFTLTVYVRAGSSFRGKGINVQAVLLRSSEVDSGTKVNVTGWDYTLEEGLQPEQLRADTTSIVELNTGNTQE